jgi:hypothetical protein
MEGSELIEQGITLDADGFKIEPNQLYMEDFDGWIVMPPWLYPETDH